MLREIGIRNFILIEDLRLDFDKGLNVLTGETGAGKTIVLDALGLLLGDRFKSEQVRQGAERAAIDGTFEAPGERDFEHWWKEHGYQKADEILIRREGYPDGRSKAYLNDQPVTLGALQELGAWLVDVHGQNEHQQILKPAVQLALLDRFGDLEEKREGVGPLFRAWKDLKEHLSAKELSEDERLQSIDVYRFQLQEIEKAQLKPGEEEELAQRLPELKNAERLQVLANGANGALYQDEGSALERLGQAEKAFQSLANLAPSVEPLSKELAEAKARLEEVAHSLQSLAGRWEADPAALEEALNRIDLIARLKKKYGSSVEAVLAHAERLRADLAGLEHTDQRRQDLEKQLAKAKEELLKASLVLSAKRKKAAKALGGAVQEELASLGLKQAVFRCRVEPALISFPLVGEDVCGVEQGRSATPHPAPSPTRGEGNYKYSSIGIDQIVFEWAPNPGEGIQPLKAIASGGEMSRVMLALKSVLAGADAVPTLVFDEIDAGIGGVMAQAVGKKLRTLARHHQILCVSHLPQIASCASAHFQVSKRTAKSRTFAVIARLDSDERVNELARLLGSNVTPTSVQHAKELLTQNQKQELPIFRGGKLKPGIDLNSNAKLLDIMEGR
jgi:DNA repair protein RecN (Recombination protein N)